MLTWYCNTELRKRPLQIFLVNIFTVVFGTFPMSAVCGGPVPSDPLIFPHFGVAGDLFHATRFPLSCVPRFCSLGISAFTP